MDIKNLAAAVAVASLAALVAGAQPTQSLGWYANTTVPGAYDFRVEPATGTSAPVIVIESVGDPMKGYGEVEKRIDAAPLRGKMVTAHVTLQGNASFALVYVRYKDGEGNDIVSQGGGTIPKHLGESRQSAGTGIPMDATAVSYGVMVTGKGLVRFAPPRLEVTDIPERKPPPKPHSQPLAGGFSGLD